MRVPPAPPDMRTLLHMVRLARQVIEALPKDRPVPREVEHALSQFYSLADYHSIAPADAPQINDDGMI